MIVICQKNDFLQIRDPKEIETRGVVGRHEPLGSDIVYKLKNVEQSQKKSYGIQLRG